jgi:hypothetical protein
MAEVVQSIFDSTEVPNLLTDPLAWVWACHRYGARGLLWYGSGGKPRFDGSSCEDKAFRTLRAEARRQAEPLRRSYDLCQSELDTRIVNAIGESAREYMQGDLWKALRRIRDAGEQATDAQKVVLGMYGAATHTLAGEPIPADLRGMK